MSSLHQKKRWNIVLAPSDNISILIYQEFILWWPMEVSVSKAKKIFRKYYRSSCIFANVWWQCRSSGRADILFANSLMSLHLSVLALSIWCIWPLIKFVFTSQTLPGKRKGLDEGLNDRISKFFQYTFSIYRKFPNRSRGLYFFFRDF